MHYLLGVFLFICPTKTTLSQEPVLHLPFDKLSSNKWTLKGGKSRLVSGVEKNSVAFDGRSSLILASSGSLTHQDRGFTLLAWVNPHQLSSRQQMIAAKNVYSRGKREWSLMIDKDNRFSAYFRQKNQWKTIRSTSKITPGHWYLVGLVVDRAQVPATASLWVNGKRTAHTDLTIPLPKTSADITLGGVNDNGKIWQNLLGALDEVSIFDEPLKTTNMLERFSPVGETHPVFRSPKKTILWSGGTFPKEKEIAVLKDVEFRVIKKWEPDKDGFRWLHGVALASHKNMLYVSFGHNKGAENTLTEQGRFCVSKDGGDTWSEIKTIDKGTGEADLAVSHGVFLSRNDQLWAFLGAFYGTRKRVHTRAYTLDESTGKWKSLGTVVGDGFWPMTQPVKLANGNWLMPGFIVGKGNPPAVAISRGDDLTKWESIVIPTSGELGRLWGESTIWADDKTVLNIARYGSKASAVVATSQDDGRTWTSATESNLSMAASKPCAGILSDGRRYLIGSTTADGGNKRSPLTIVLSEKDKNTLSKVYVIRHANFPDGPGESHANASLAYPYAIEQAGKLYVGYSNSGGRGGNQNSAELAIIPLSSLK